MAVYQGPVPIGADEKLFRDTGLTGTIQDGRFVKWSRVGSSKRSTPAPPIVYTSSLLGQSFTSQQAKATAEAEYRRRQEEARKLQEQLRRKKEQQAFAGTIGGQVKTTKTQTFTPSGASISAYDSESKYTDTPYRQSFLASAGMAGRSLLSDLGQGKLRRWRDYTDVFEYSEGIKRDQPATLISSPLQGTLITDPSTGQDIRWKRTDPFTGIEVKGTTKGDVQRAREQARQFEMFTKITPATTKKVTGVYADWQKKYEAGETTYEQAVVGAEKEVDVLNIGYREEQEKLYKKYPDMDILGRTGTTRRIVNLAPDVAVIGGATAVGIFSPVAGVGIATGYFAGKGIMQGVAKPTYEEIREQGGIFAGVGKDEAGRLKILEPTALDIKYKGLRREAGINLLFAGASGVGLAGATSKSILAQELKELGQSPVKVLSVTYQKGDTSFAIVKGFQKSGGLQRQITITGKVLKQGDKSFIMPSGTGQSTTTGTFDWMLYKGYSPTYYAGADTFKVGSKGATTFINDKYFTLGKGVVEPSFRFGGAFKEVTPNIIKDIAKKTKVGGKPDTSFFASISERIGKDTAGAEYYKFASGKITKDVLSGTQLFKTNVAGFQKVVSPARSSIDDVWRFTKFGGTGTKQIKGFTGGAVTEGLLKDVSQTITKSQVKTITTPSIVEKSMLLPSIYAGTGQYERTDAVSVLIGRGTRNILGTDMQIKQMSGSGLMRSLEFRPDVTLRKDVVSGMNLLTGRATTRSVQRQIMSPVSIQRMMDVSAFAVQGSVIGTGIRSKSIQGQIQQQQLIQQIPMFQPSPIFGTFGSGIAPKFPLWFPKPKAAGFELPGWRKSQRRKQPVRYQVSLTGAFTGAKLQVPESLAGGLGVRGYKNNKK